MSANNSSLIADLIRHAQQSDRTSAPCVLPPLTLAQTRRIVACLTVCEGTETSVLESTSGSTLESLVNAARDLLLDCVDSDDFRTDGSRCKLDDELAMFSIVPTEVDGSDWKGPLWLKGLPA